MMAGLRVAPGASASRHHESEMDPSRRRSSSSFLGGNASRRFQGSGSFRGFQRDFPTQDVLMSGHVWKKVPLSSGEDWQQRRVAITKTEVAFSRVGETALVDRIPLLDVTLIHKKAEDDRGNRREEQHHVHDFRREEKGLDALPARKRAANRISEIQQSVKASSAKLLTKTSSMLTRRQSAVGAPADAERQAAAPGATNGESKESQDSPDHAATPPLSPTADDSMSLRRRLGYQFFTQQQSSFSDNENHERHRRHSIVDTVMTGVRKLSHAMGPHHAAHQASSGGHSSMFVIHTREGGYNSGIPYFLKVETEEELQEWVHALKAAVREAFKQKEREADTKLADRLRKGLRHRFHDHRTQLVIAAVIVINFVTNVVYAEILPEPGSMTQQWLDKIEVACTACFVAELIVNMVVHWFYEFWSDGWNWFDLFAVTASMLALVTDGVPGFGVFRLIRVFRVIRLFRKLTSMRVIINAFISSCKPVLTAFVIVLLVTCLYSVLAVEFFSERQPHYFGTFSKALFTMCQMGTGDNWGAISRESFDDGAESWDPSAAFFFLSYVVLVGIVLLNIVVAVLLDEFIQSMAHERWIASQSKAAIEDPGAKTTTSLDPVLSTLASLNDADDVTNRVQDLFELLDAPRQSGKLTYQDLAEGLRKLEFEQSINLSREDYDCITDDGQLCDTDECIGPEEFHRVFRKQLRLFVQRRLSNELRNLDNREGDVALGTVLYDLKQLNIRLDELHHHCENEQGKLMAIQLRNSSQLCSLASKLDQLIGTNTPRSVESMSTRDLPAASSANGTATNSSPKSCLRNATSKALRGRMSRTFCVGKHSGSLDPGSTYGVVSSQCRALQQTPSVSSMESEDAVQAAHRRRNSSVEVRVSELEAAQSAAIAHATLGSTPQPGGGGGRDRRSRRMSWTLRSDATVGEDGLANVSSSEAALSAIQAAMADELLHAAQRRAAVSPANSAQRRANTGRIVHGPEEDGSNLETGIDLRIEDRSPRSHAGFRLLRGHKTGSTSEPSSRTHAESVRRAGSGHPADNLSSSDDRGGLLASQDEGDQPEPEDRRQRWSVPRMRRKSSMIRRNSSESETDLGEDGVIWKSPLITRASTAADSSNSLKSLSKTMSSVGSWVRKGAQLLTRAGSWDKDPERVAAPADDADDTWQRTLSAGTRRELQKVGDGKLGIGRAASAFP